MKTLGALMKRNIKLFFKDKALFFTSLITPLILLVLYSTFLAKVYRESFEQFMPAGTPDSLVKATVGGQLFSSLLAVCCVTVAFCSNMLMVTDKVNGARNDFLISPVKRSVIAVSYYLSSVFSTLIICLVATGACMIYVASVGWYMRAADVFLVLLDVLLLVLFGTGLSSVINFFLSSQGQISAVGTAISAGYGFICGAYMPISMFGKGLGHVLSFLPGTYGTSLVRNHTLAGVFAEMQSLGWSDEVLVGIRDSVDCNLYFFGHAVSVGAMYGILCVTVALLIGVYVLLHMFWGKRKTVLRGKKSK
ncbi:MAG: ABC transporter permease [Clostridia bacterium]|nr:ABC transporter permease [Clostridia bacterium]